MLEIDAGGFHFVARLEEKDAPQTVTAFRRLLPLESRIIHGEGDVLVGRQLVGMVRDTPVLAADEQHPALDPRGGEDAGVVAGARGELDRVQPAALDRVSQRLADTRGHLYRFHAIARLE